MSDEHSYTTGGDLTLLHCRVIGRGGSGVVHAMYDVQSGKSFARKLVHIPWAEVKVLENEIKVLTELSVMGVHPHIVAVLRIGELRNRYLFIDMELCDLNLLEYIYCTKPRQTVPPYFIKDQPAPMKARQIWTVMVHISKGVQYLHHQNVVHRDLKPANVLYSRRDEVWKLADFGLSTHVSSQSLRVTTSIGGTIGYLAPEFLLGDRPSYNNKVDIWSLGCILFELAVGKRAFESEFYTHQYMANGALPEIVLDEYTGEEDKNGIRNAITKMLKLDASMRPTAATLVEEFSQNRQRTIEERPESVQIYQEFQAVYDNAGLVSKFTLLTVDSKKKMVLAEIEKEPVNYWSWHALSTLFSAENNLYGAIAACKGAYRKSCGNPSPIMELTNLYAAKGDYHNAVMFGGVLRHIKPAIFQSALIAPSNPLILSILSDFESKRATAKTMELKLADNVSVVKGWLSRIPAFSPIIHSATTQILHAGWSGDMDHLKAFAGGPGQDVTIDDTAGFTALYLGVANMHLEFTRTLIQIVKNLSYLSSMSSNGTPLHIASSNDDPDMIRLLGSSGADPTVRDAPHKLEAIHFAAIYGASSETIKALVEIGANIHSKDHRGRTAVYFAAAHNRVATLQCLRDMDFNISARDIYGVTPSHVAAAKNHVEVVQWLKEAGADIFAVSDEGDRVVHAAARMGSIGVIQYLREAGEDLSVRNQKNGSTPMHVAADEGKAEVVGILIEAGADSSAYDNNGCTPIHRAAASGQVSSLKAFRECGLTLSIKTRGFESAPIHFAAEQSHILTVQYLLGEGVDANSRNADDETPLHYAARGGADDVVRILREYGVDPLARAKDGKHPMHYAARQGQVETIRVLIRIGADVDARDLNGWTPMHAAAQQGHAEAIPVLREFAANVDAKTKAVDGGPEHADWTPLHCAAENGHILAVKELKKAGASLEMRDARGATAADVAKQKGQMVIANLLKVESTPKQRLLRLLR